MWSRFVMSQVKHNSYFLCGVALGLWVSLAAIPLDEEAHCAGSAAGAGERVADEFEPVREERPLGPAGQPGRSVQRPRYYSTELGMRGSLLTGVLSSEGALKTQVAALNQTMARLQPALKFFITASAMSAVPGLANVVGFTDTREMLKPFHALKYLADNYLEEFDFFFLAGDGAFVNARRLADLVAGLSASQDVYMGEPAGDDSHYCSLEGGILLSNSVLRGVHAALDWCVRNSYSAHHHENIGRCVLHAAHLPCQARHQGESYLSARLEAGALHAALADAVTVRAAAPRDMHRLHAFVSRVRLQRARGAARRLRGALGALAARHPPGARNASWPAGLRADPGLRAPPPDNRFEHLRWTLFNATHVFMPDELRAAAPLAAPAALALQLVVDNVRAWALKRWAWASSATLAEGAWQWEPPAALRYRLLLRLTGPRDTQVLRLVEAARALGAARLVPVRYVTESARVELVLPVRLEPAAVRDAAALLARLRPPAANTALHVVAFRTAEPDQAALLERLRAAAEPSPAPLLAEGAGDLGRRAVRALAARLPPDALVLLLAPHLEFNQDFLNRVRMNTIQGASWFLPLAFRRHALSAQARRARARSPSGRFNAQAHDVVAFYRSDLDAAEAAWRGGAEASAARVLAAGALRGVVAPEPAAVASARPAPCREPAAAARAACRAALRPAALDLGARTALAQLLLEAQHDAA